MFVEMRRKRKQLQPDDSYADKPFIFQYTAYSIEQEPKKKGRLGNETLPGCFPKIPRQQKSSYSNTLAKRQVELKGTKK